MDKRIPNVGEVLVHRFRQGKGEVRAEVISVDPKSRSVSVRMEGKEYNLLVSRGGGRRGYNSKRLRGCLRR